MIDAFLKIFPLFPRALAEKYADFLEYELAVYSDNYGSAIKKQWYSINPNLPDIPAKNFNGSINALNPTNERYIIKNYMPSVAGLVPIFVYKVSDIDRDMIFDNTSIQKYSYLFNEPYNAGSIKIDLQINFDKRIFENISVLQYRYVVNGPVSAYRSFLYVYTYMSANGYIFSSVDLRPIPVYKIKKYNGAESVLAMVENGIYDVFNKAALYEFMVFVNSYSKYNQQLSSFKNLSEEKSRQNIVEYKTTLSDKFNARKNELNDLMTQISFAALNETNSAKRDMQNLSLSAQSLILQLQDRLK